MKQKTKPTHSGGRKVKPGERQKEAATGRKHDVAAKAAFKAGSVARTDPNAGRAKPLLPAGQVAVPGRTYNSEVAE